MHGYGRADIGCLALVDVRRGTSEGVGDWLWESTGGLGLLHSLRSCFSG